MIYQFKAYGHKNITAKHKKTLEFTKDKNLTLAGDCIIGVNADFSLDKIKAFLRSLKNNRIKIIMQIGKSKEEINCEVNPGFCDKNEMVIRKSNFLSDRTFGINADKASFEFNRNLIIMLNKAAELSIILIA